MNSAVIELLNMRNDIKHGPWLSFPPSNDDMILNVRAEWFFEGDTFGFEMSYGLGEMIGNKASLIEAFVRAANTRITRAMAKRGVQS